MVTFLNKEKKMKKIVIILFVYLLVGCVSTNLSIANDNVYTSAEVDSPAAWIVQIDPIYPEEAYKNLVEGFVMFTGVINEAGSLTEIKIIDSSPKGVFERNAIKALKKWKYMPATIRGKAVKTHHTEKLEFKI